MRFALLFLFLLPALAIAEPKARCQTGEVRALIDAEIQKGVRATIAKDIDAYMDGVPDDYRIVEPDGTAVDKAVLHDYALKSWAIIDKTNALSITIDSLEVEPNCKEARAKTSQRWERVMRRRDNSGTDNVLTTQTHEERWRSSNGRWFN
jgi:hypothetical protein